MGVPRKDYELLQGDLTDLPRLTEKERDILMQAAWDLNKYVPPVVDGPQFWGLHYTTQTTLW